MRGPFSAHENPPRHLRLQCHPPSNLLGQPPLPKALSAQLPRLSGPDLHADPPFHKPLLQRPDPSLDPALLAHHVVQLLPDNGGRGEHLVDVGDVAFLRPGLRGGDGGVGAVERGLQDGDVGLEGGGEGGERLELGGQGPGGGGEGEVLGLQMGKRRGVLGDGGVEVLGQGRGEGREEGVLLGVGGDGRRGKIGGRDRQ